MMQSVSQRELRNNTGELLRRVAAGEHIRITNKSPPPTWSHRT
jgi:prevent-host-death family protein